MGEIRDIDYERKYERRLWENVEGCGINERKW